MSVITKCPNCHRYEEAVREYEYGLSVGVSTAYAVFLMLELADAKCSCGTE